MSIYTEHSVQTSAARQSVGRMQSSAQRPSGPSRAVPTTGPAARHRAPVDPHSAARAATVAAERAMGGRAAAGRTTARAARLFAGTLRPR
jgi:hypothetical protein